MTFAQAAERLVKPPFRLLTPDEWEYACAGGARTLFHWGNDCPVDVEPSGPATRSLRYARNAFGLRIAYHPNCLEGSAPPETIHASDGGRALHSGMPPLISWLLLASAFQSELRVNSTHAWLHLRRVRPLAERGEA